MAIGANKTKAAVIELSLVIFVPSKSYVASEYEMRALRRLDARKQKNLRRAGKRFSRTKQRRGPREIRAFRVVASEGTLGDDLCGLHQQGDRAQRKQCDCGGEADHLGHLCLPWAWCGWACLRDAGACDLGCVSCDFFRA